MHNWTPTFWPPAPPLAGGCLGCYLPASKEKHTLSLTHKHTQARDAKHPIGDKHDISREDNRAERPNVLSTSNNGSCGFMGTPEYQTPKSSFKECNVMMHTQKTSFIRVFSPRRLTHTTGRSPYLPPLCTARMPHLINIRKLLKTHQIAEKLQRTSNVNSEGPLDKVHRVQQLHTFAFATYLSSKRSPERRRRRPAIKN